MSRYKVEIQQMMFVSGEVQEPLTPTTNLIENIIRSQIIEMLSQATSLSSLRGSKSIQIEDLFFLIRHDSAKVSRLRTYLSWKDVRKNTKDQDGTAGNEAMDVLVDDSSTYLVDSTNDKLSSTRLRKKRISLPWELSRMFIEPVPDRHNDDDDYDDPQSVENLLDIDEEEEDHAIIMARLKEADDRTRNMTRGDYVHWSECRQASFTYRKSKRFREWCSMSSFTESRPNDDIIDTLGFLAFEGVVKLVRDALEVKSRLDIIENNISTRQANSQQNYLFSAPVQTQTPLEPRHIEEAFRRLQKGIKPTCLRNFTGGTIKSKTTIF